MDQCELLLFVTCLGCQNSQLAQLRRLFVVTPDTPAGDALALGPRVSFTALDSPVDAAKSWLFELGRPVALPSNAFLCLCFPYTYATADGRPLRQASVNAPYMSVLLRGHLQQTKHVPLAR
eukprot:TRINITY_DN2929_c1_g1_i4.p1 TRINITY_DN2929_c1_g1~~TRINITY_DN2929_c1_g1_i4.p1  ORF type:complete len:121 (+),score=19.43 TRINITY_DN2929_c1_g1_i4:341-703(+)